jgi:hypothetical protein
MVCWSDPPLLEIVPHPIGLRARNIFAAIS